MYEEESDRFLDLKEGLPIEDQKRMTRRYQEEFDRYLGNKAYPASESIREARTTDMSPPAH
jgi:hypothetical protein